ncbi:MAG: multicopper oxidase family protein [bacterium]|nr:multicopper oxidase family protein [bacterium]
MSRRFSKIFLLASLALSLSACTAEPTVQNSQPTQEVSLHDGDSYTLTAQEVVKTIEEKQVKMFAYNGSIPGPTLRIPQGASIALNLINQTPIPTLLHSHGVRMKSEFDGTHLVQDPIQLGESFKYELDFPDAGVYWYHPHLREDYAQEMGLYGLFIVEPSDPDYWNPADREVALVIDDILMTENGIAPFSDIVDHALMGRYGNTFLVNGDTDYSMDAVAGEILRFHLLNASSARPYRLVLPDLPMKLVGSDGGKLEQEQFESELILSPSERATVEVLFSEPGTYALLNETPQSTQVLTSIEVSGENVATSKVEEFSKLRINEGLLAEFKPYRDRLNTAPDKILRLSMDMGHGGMAMMDMGSSEKIEWEDEMGMMNAHMTTDMVTWKLVDEQTGKVNEDIDWSFQRGEIIKIRLINDPSSTHPMQHPIHIHGQRFLVLATNGVATDNLAWKDTALVQTGDTVDLLVEMSNPGQWMLHCHISEHLESGMSLAFSVKE